MKRIIFSVAIAAMFFSSCDRKEHQPVRGNEEVKFAINGPATRVTTTNNVTAFEVGDQIEITSTGLVTDLADAAYSVAAAGLTGTGAAYYDGDNSAAFVAHYPAEAATDAQGAIAMTILSDQTSKEKFHNNMFMVAQTEGSAAVNSGLVAFTFEHQTAMLKVIVSGVDDAEAVTVNGVVPDIKWTNGVVSAGTADPINVKAWKQGDTQEYWAVVPAQTFKSGEKFLSITAGTKTYEYVLAADLTVTAAKVKTVTLTVAEAEKVVATFAIDDVDWTDEADGLEGEVVEKIEPPVELISADQGDFTKVTSLKGIIGGISSVTEEGWWQVGAEANATVKIADGALNLTASTSGSSWYNRTVVCRTPAAKEAKFTLKFTAKASAPTDLQLAVMVPEATSNTWYKLGSNTSAVYCSLSTEYVEKTYEVDLSTVSTGTPAPEKGVIVLFTDKIISGYTVSIKDVTLIENK